MTTLNLQVAANGDDGWASVPAGSFSNSSDNFLCGDFNGANYKLASYSRFLNVTIPVGATIIAATMTFKAATTQSGGGLTARIRAVDADSPTAPNNSTTYNANARTTAQVDWSVPDMTSGTNYTTPDISAVIQEVIDRAGWASGNAMMLYTEDPVGNAAGTIYRRAVAYNTTPADAPKLDITYTAAGGTSIPVMMNQYRQRWARAVQFQRRKSGLYAPLNSTKSIVRAS